MSTTTAPETLARIPLAEIIASTTNPRKSFDPAKLAELAESIQATGVHQPVLLRPLPASRLEDTAGMSPRPGYELVCGERRLRASVLAEKADIPALIRDLTDAEALEAQIIENLQRDDLLPLEEAEGYQALMQRHEPPMTAEEVGTKIGKSKSYVYARLKLLDLGVEGQQALRDGKLDPSRALLIARIPSTQLQVQAIEAITDWNGNSRSFREAASIVQSRFMLRLSAAKFKITDATLVADAGSCRACPKRTGANPDLFADVDGADVCTDPPCFKAKEAAHSDAQLKAARESGATIIEGREAKALMPHSYMQRVDGFLRLDSAEDSPDKKPLRALIGKQMEKQGIKPTLVANPHKDGELVAVIDHATAQQLLTAKGYEDHAEKLAAESARDEKAAAEEAKAKAKRRFEEAWRWRVLETAWARIRDQPEGHYDVSDKTIRHLAQQLANRLNQEQAKRLAKLLDLGAVAPHAGVCDWVRDHPEPERALALLVMRDDVEWRTWGSEASQANQALLDVATDDRVGVDIEAVKAEVKKEHVATTRAAAKKAEAKAAQPSRPLPSAAPAQGKGGEPRAKTTGKPKATPTKKPRLSAKDAKAGIAAAMQSNENGADAGPVDTDPAGASAGEQEDQRPTPAAGNGQQQTGLPGETLLDAKGGPLRLGHRILIVGDQFNGKFADVAGITDGGDVIAHITGLEGEYLFQPGEVQSLGDGRAAWPFPNSAP